MECELPRDQITDGGRKDMKIPCGKEISYKEKELCFLSPDTYIGCLKKKLKL
jgi:hypothetical protein